MMVRGSGKKDEIKSSTTNIKQTHNRAIVAPRLVVYLYQSKKNETLKSEKKRCLRQSAVLTVLVQA
jgi:hypothetical protein